MNQPAKIEACKNAASLAQQVADEHPDKTIRVWFQDEARFGQQGTLTRKWARTGSRPPAVKQTRYGYLYVLGAACPATGRSVGLLSPHLNTQVVNAFFTQFKKEVDPAVHVVMFWDHPRGPASTPRASSSRPGA